MKVLLDTNIIVDNALERQPFWETSEQVLLLVEQGQVEGYISASTFGDLYYIILDTPLPEVRRFWGIVHC